MSSPTLFEKLGMPTHVSSLLMKLKRNGLVGIGDIQNEAYRRGCTHYGVCNRVKSINTDSISDSELGVALLSGVNEYNPRLIRIGAQLISRETDAFTLYWMAKKERCEVILRYIAKCGQQVEPLHEFWTNLLGHLKEGPLPSEGLMPHWSRFVWQTGIVSPLKKKSEKIKWIR
jgi:hypothetical protein